MNFFRNARLANTSFVLRGGGYLGQQLSRERHVHAPTFGKGLPRGFGYFNGALIGLAAQRAGTGIHRGQ
jgi:hypothetical protein